MSVSLAEFAGDPELQLRMAARLGAIGAWTVAVGPLRVTVSREWLALLDWAGAAPPRLLAVLRLLSRPMRRQLLQKFRGCLHDRTPFDTIVTARTFGGRAVSFRVIGEPLGGADGAVRAVQGACQDISQQVKRSRQAVAFARRLTSTMESMAEGFLVLDREWHIVYLNAAAERMVRRSRGELVSKVVWDCFPDALNSAFHHYLERALAEYQPYVFQEFAPGLDMWLEVRAYPSDEGLAVYLADVTQKRAVEAELLAYREQLEELVAQRTRELGQINDELTGFTLAVAHDLRAPLAAVTGYSRALAERLLPDVDPKAGHYLQRVQTAAQRMEAMINALIELARVGQAPLEPRSVNLSAVAADVVEILRASARGRPVQVEIAPGLAAHGDPQLLRTVLDNVIGNAWKFSAGRNPALIEVGQSADGAFYVRDNGTGFEMAYAQNLFSPFQRLHPEGAFDGAGVGLATVRRAVQRHGGVVWAESQPGVGTTMWFTLPPAPAA